MRLDGEKQRKKQMPSWPFFFFFFVKSIRLPGRVDPEYPSFQPQPDCCFCPSIRCTCVHATLAIGNVLEGVISFLLLFAARVVRTLSRTAWLQREQSEVSGKSLTPTRDAWLSARGCARGEFDASGQASRAHVDSGCNGADMSEPTATTI